MQIQYDRSTNYLPDGTVVLTETKTATVPNDATFEASLAEFFTPEPPADPTPELTEQ